MDRRNVVRGVRDRGGGGGSSIIGRSGSCLLVHVPRHGAGKSDPCQNENADIVSSGSARSSSSSSTLFSSPCLSKMGLWSRNVVKLVERDHVSQKVRIKAGPPLVDAVLPSFKHHLQHHLSRIETELEDQVRDSGQPLISTIPTIRLSWICITGNRPSSYLALYSAIIDTFLEKSAENPNQLFRYKFNWNFFYKII